MFQVTLKDAVALLPEVPCISLERIQEYSTEAGIIFLTDSTAVLDPWPSYAASEQKIALGPHYLEE